MSYSKNEFKAKLFALLEYREEVEQIAERAGWRFRPEVAKKVTDPAGMDSHSYDYHHDNPRSTGMMRATSDTETPDYDKRRPAEVSTQGPRKGMATRRHIERLKDKIRGKQIYGDKSKPNLPEEFEQIDEQFTLHAVHDEMGTKKKLGSFASKGEAAAHLNKLEKAGKFPEGHEAVLTHNATGEKHVYTDKWEQMDEMAPPGREDQVRALKKAGVENPWAVAWASYNKSKKK